MTMPGASARWDVIQLPAARFCESGAEALGYLLCHYSAGGATEHVVGDFAESRIYEFQDSYYWGHGTDVRVVPIDGSASPKSGVLSKAELAGVDGVASVGVGGYHFVVDTGGAWGINPTDMGKTALAFMPLYAAAQAKARGGKAPCTLEFYAKVHAEMSFKKDPMGNKMNHHLVLAENGTHHQAWIECEAYWTPIVGAPMILGEPNPKFEPAQSQQFAALIQTESDRVNAIKS